MGIILNVIGGIFVFYGISCFIQSFRHADSVVALRQDGIYESPEKTSKRLRIMAIIFILIGIIIFISFEGKDMSVIISIASFIVAFFLLLIGIGFNKGYRSSRMESNLMGSEGFASGYEIRQTILLIMSIIFFFLALILFYNAFTRSIF